MVVAQDVMITSLLERNEKHSCLLVGSRKKSDQFPGNLFFFLPATFLRIPFLDAISLHQRVRGGRGEDASRVQRILSYHYPYAGVLCICERRGQHHFKVMISYQLVSSWILAVGI